MLTSMSIAPSTCLRERLSIFVTPMTAKKDTITKVRRMSQSFWIGTCLRFLIAGMRAVRIASIPLRAVASPYDGIRWGSRVIMNMPNPNPLTLCVKAAASAARDMMSMMVGVIVVRLTLQK